MVKRIVLLSDGTGNSSASPFKTNVWRLYEALDVSEEKGQIAFYDDGVGSSSSKPVAAITGAVGIGLKRNVLDLYKFLSRQYVSALNQGSPPQIACFGFSRGAFTIRVLVGLVQSQGLLRATSESELNRLARRAYAAYRKPNFHTKLHVEAPVRWLRDRIIVPIADGKLPPYDKDNNVQPEDVHIHFLGLWDTVGAYGMPLEEIRIAIDKLIFPLTFTGTRLWKNVDAARHALSIDDERDAFTPIPWDDAKDLEDAKKNELAAGKTEKQAEAAAKATVAKRISQLWFAGVHADVGGGYPDDTMSYTPLKWMMEEALNFDVEFRHEAKDRIRAMATPYGQMHDSRAGLGGLYRYTPRDIDQFCNPKDKEKKGKSQQVKKIPLVHESVVFRMASGFDGYAPIADNLGLTEIFAGHKHVFWAEVDDDGVIRRGRTRRDP